MLRLTFLLSLSLLTFAAAFAQAGGGRFADLTPEQRAERQTRHLAEALTLTEEQVPQVQALLLRHAQQNDQLRDNTALDREEKMLLFREQRAAQVEELQAVLTEEQWNQYQTMQEERRQNRRTRAPNGGR